MDSRIFHSVGALLYPFLILYGFHLIVSGDLTPGGGFQGGVILATAFFIRYLLQRKNPFNIRELARLEKVLFLVILILGIISLFSRGEVFTNFMPQGAGTLRRIFLVLLNVLIGLKVTTGVISIISSFVEEGDQL